MPNRADSLAYTTSYASEWTLSLLLQIIHPILVKKQSAITYPFAIKIMCAILSSPIGLEKTTFEGASDTLW